MFKERLTKAQVSKNLSEVPVNEIGDIDLVRACGMAGASNPLGLAIWRWRYAGDTREVFYIAETLVEMGNEPLRRPPNLFHRVHRDAPPVQRRVPGLPRARVQRDQGRAGPE